MEFRIELDEDTMSKSNSLVTGEIWLRVADFDFPSAHWNDFVVVILGWWTQALLELQETKTAEWSFMDGPWTVRLSRQTQELIELRFYDNHGDETTEPTELRRIPVSRTALQENLTRAGKRVMEKCETAGWLSPELEILRANLERL